MTTKQINFQKKAAIVLIGSGGILFALPVQSSVAQNSVSISLGAGLIMSAIGAVLVAIGSRLHYRAKQYAAKNLAEKITSGNSDRDLLFLRPFSADGSLEKTRKGPNITTVMQNMQPSLEEDLYEVLLPLGNLVAIGKPGEKLPVPGAIRTYADADWQNIITEKMKKSKLVIIEAGESEGLNWELQEAFKIVDPKKLLLLIPQMSKKNYDKYRQLALENFAVSLPNLEPVKHANGQVAMGFIRFSDNKTPEFLPVAAPIFRVNPYKPLYASFQYALKPLFEENGIEWKMPPFRKAYVVVIAFFGLFFLFMIVLFILSALGKIDAF